MKHRNKFLQIALTIFLPRRLNLELILYLASFLISLGFGKPTGLLFAGHQESGVANSHGVSFISGELISVSKLT